jgi:DNA-binding transcriptional LysR family regulator
VTNVGTAVGLVEAGLALSVLPRHALAHARGEGVVAVPLVDPVVERDIVALTSPRRPLTDALAAFVALLREPIGGTAAAPTLRPD